MHGKDLDEYTTEELRAAWVTILDVYQHIEDHEDTAKTHHECMALLDAAAVFSRLVRDRNQAEQLPLGITV